LERWQNGRSWKRTIGSTKPSERENGMKEKTSNRKGEKPIRSDRTAKTDASSQGTRFLFLGQKVLDELKVLSRLAAPMKRQQEES
jgi:hypothetical protein